MPVQTADALLDALRESGLLEEAQLEELGRAWKGRESPPGDLARYLRDKGWVTAFQAEQLVQGRADRLVLGPYRLLDRLGSGGMGDVYKALHQNLQRVVALKVIRQEHTSRPQILERFRREAWAAARLAHPNIVTLYDADQVGDTYFLAMEYIDGIDLGRLVQKAGPLPVAQACDYARQAALGLHHAHERGLVHRDVKPSNLLVRAPDHTEPGMAPPADKGTSAARYAGGVVKVLDMGIARMLAEASSEANLTQEGAVLGTVDYLAPEQASNSRAADRRADLYSLGCTLYHLLAGQPPFAEGNPFTKMVQHQTEEPRPLTGFRPDVPAGVVAVLNRLLAKRPEDRFQTAAEAAAALAAPEATAASPTVVSPSSLLPSPSSPTGPTVLELDDPWPETSAEALTPIPAGDPRTAAPGPARRRTGRRALTALIIAGAIGMGFLALRPADTSPKEDPPGPEGQLATETPAPTPTPKPPPPPEGNPLAGFVHPRTAALFTLKLRQMLDSPTFQKLHGPQWEATLRQGERGWAWVPLVGADPRKDLQLVQFTLFPHGNSAPLILARGHFDPAHFSIGPGRLEEAPPGFDKSFRFFNLKDSRTGKVAVFAPIGPNLVIAEGYRLAAVVSQATGVTKARPEDSLMQELLKEVNRDQSVWLAASFDKLGPVPRLDNKVLETYLRPVFRNLQAVQGGVTYRTDEVLAEFTFRAKDDDAADKLEKYLRDTCEAAKGAHLVIKDKELLPLFQLLATGQERREGKRLTVRCRLTPGKPSR